MSFNGPVGQSENEQQSLLKVASTNKVEHKVQYRQGINEIVTNQRGLKTIKGRISNARLDLGALMGGAFQSGKGRPSETEPLARNQSQGI